MITVIPTHVINISNLMTPDPILEQYSRMINLSNDKSVKTDYIENTFDMTTDMTERRRSLLYSSKIHR